MNKSNLNLVYEFNQDFEIVYEHILDFTKFGELHPAMKEVKLVLNQVSDFAEYEVSEEVKLFGLIKMHPHYTAKIIEVEKHGHIRYLSEVSKGVHLKIDFTFERQGGIVKVNEALEVSGNKIVCAIFLNILSKAHKKVFEGLKQKK